MKVVYSEECLEYSQPGHPESPDRVRRSCEYLKEKYEFVSPAPVADEHILRVHTPALLEIVKSGNFYDADSPAYPKIYEHALRAAGAAVTACELAIGGQPAFSLMRPPGHHAGRDALGGFCYFNNVAVAVATVLPVVKRVAIIDFDCHHGNGTEDIFRGRREVLYLSTHQSPLYPGTGVSSVDNCRNYPLPAGTDEAAYLPVFEDALQEVKRFDPDLIAVSAGFDTYKLDPITGMALDMGTFGKIGNAIASLGKPTFSVLEGGYAAELPRCIESYLMGIGDDTE